MRRKVKPSIPKGVAQSEVGVRLLERNPELQVCAGDSSSFQEEDEDDGEDFESDYEEESYHLNS